MQLDNVTLIQQLASSTLIDNLFDNMELNLLKQMVLTESHEKIKREELYQQVKLLTTFKASLRHYLNEYSVEEGD